MAADIKVPTPVVAAPTRPCLLDYFLVWLGVGVSALLAELAGLRAVLPGATPGPGVQALLRVVPVLLFLPVGVILGWPLFYLSQWLLGRRQGLSTGEWLLGIAWLGSLALAGWIIARGTDSLPAALIDDNAKRLVIFGYVLAMLSLGALAVLVALVGMLGRWQQPWTHTLSLTLLIWPAAPLLVVWLTGLKLE